LVWFRGMASSSSANFLNGGGHWFEPYFEPLVGGGVTSPGAAPVPPYGLLLPGDELLGGVLLGPPALSLV